MTRPLTPAERAALSLHVSLANIYAKEFPITQKNKKLVELTTATGYKSVDKSRAKAYVEVDGKHTDWTREFSYSEINRL